MAEDKPNFWENIENIFLVALRDFLRILGPIGALIYFFIKTVEKWTTLETRDKIIQKYILNIDMLPEYISKTGLCTIMNFILIAIMIIVIIVFRKRERELKREMKRISIEKTKLQEEIIGPLETSN